jgi:hypothetical protein
MFTFLDLLSGLADLFPWFKRKKDRHREWTGTVEAKKTRILSRYAYLVVFRTDEGRKRTVRLENKEDFDIYEEGRIYVKKEGEVMPKAGPPA